MRQGIMLALLLVGCRDDATPAGERRPSPQPARASHAEIEAMVAKRLLELERPPSVEAVDCPPGDLLAMPSFECLATHTGFRHKLVVDATGAQWSEAQIRYRDYVRVSTHGGLARIRPALYRAPYRYLPANLLGVESRAMFVDRIREWLDSQTIRIERVVCDEIEMSRPAECQVNGLAKPMIVLLVEDQSRGGIRRYVDSGWKKDLDCTRSDPLDPDRCQLPLDSFEHGGHAEMFDDSR